MNKTYKLVSVNKDNGLLDLRKVEGLNVYLLGIVEFNHQYSVTWYMVKSNKIDYVLSSYSTKEFWETACSDRGLYLTKIPQNMKMRVDPKDFQLWVDVEGKV
jgi:hypothetical protein